MNEISNWFLNNLDLIISTVAGIGLPWFIAVATKYNFVDEKNLSRAKMLFTILLSLIFATISAFASDKIDLANFATSAIYIFSLTQTIYLKFNAAIENLSRNTTNFGGELNTGEKTMKEILDAEKAKSERNEND